MLQGACVSLTDLYTGQCTVVSLLLFADLWLSGKAGHLVHFRVTLVLHNLVPSLESVLQLNNPVDMVHAPGNSAGVEGNMANFHQLLFLSWYYSLLDTYEMI